MIRLRVGLRLALGLFIAFAAAPSGTGAQTAQAEPNAQRKQQARVHFERAIELADDQRLPEAMVEFKRAYELSPHFAVLYNLGKTHASIGMPVEAVDVLEAYLREGGDTIAEARRAEVTLEIERQKARIGRLELQVLPEGADVFVDELAIGKAPLGAAIRLALGAHVLRVSAADHATFTERITLAGGEKRALAVRLERHGSAAAAALASVASSAEIGLLRLRCAVPDAEVRVDGALVGRTPLPAPLALAIGTRRLRLVRDGYAAEERALAVQPGALHELECSLRAKPDPARAAVLTVAASEAQARVLVDEQPLPADGRIPHGGHEVRVLRAGFAPWQQRVVLREQERHTLRATLRPEPAFRRDYESRASTQRILGYVLGGSGVALAGGALALFLWNDARFDDWEREDAALLSRAASLETLDRNELGQFEQRQNENNDLLVSVHTWDTVTVGAAAAGLVLGATGLVLLLTGDDPDRYDELDVGVDMGPRGAALRAAHRF